jgi:hypothetical protein
MAKDKQEPGVSLSLPEDIRRELLESQKESIGTPQRLPQLSIMPAGVNLFEFKDTAETTQRFSGVILHNHPRNVLWDKKFGQGDVPEDERFPACSSPDGKYGTPRQGFRHVELGGTAARGDELISCDTCTYNKWNTGSMLIADKNPKGKATSNYRQVYVLTEGRESPLDLSLPATSIPAFDEYLTSLLNRGQPVQSVLTEFSLVKKEKPGGMRWSVAQFKAVRPLTNEEFAAVMEARGRYMQAMAPESAPAAPSATGLSGVPLDMEDDDDMPF